METLSELLQPYEPIVASLASVITMAQFLAPGVICKEIYQAKSTKGKVAMPFVGGIILGCLMMIYANILNDPVMIRVNYVGISLNVLYAIFYYIYAEDKNDLLRPLSYGTVILAVVYAYSKIEDEELIENRLGLFVTLSMFTFIASPLFGVKEIMAKRNAETLPMPMIYCGAVVSILWLLYGIIILNNFMIVQNVVGLLLCFIQILVWVFFRGGVAQKKGKKSKTKKVQ